MVNFTEIRSQTVDFALNIWDFGGQDIYAATHRFFLSERSLYAVVADTRQDNTDFFYWLHICELFGGESPCLIVLNEKFGRTRSIDYNTLRGRFDALKNKLHVDFADNRGLPELRSEIKHQASSMPHIGSPVPATWVDVRKSIENLPENAVSREKYLEICKEAGMSAEDSKLLSGYFHDIGVFLHFTEDDLLRDTVFLEPSWVTNAVFKIVDCPDLLKNNGHFDRTLVEKMLPGEEYDGFHHKILQMMKKFRLIFEINDTKEYISPQHLANDRPQLESLSAPISMVFDYEIFMPKGIVNQLTVLTHDYAPLELIWKSGVVLKKDNSRAVVIESYGERKITIEAGGPFKRDLMTMIFTNLETINNSYKKLKVNKLIPCKCRECRDLKEPHYYKYENLINRISRKRYDDECDKSLEKVSVIELLDNNIDVTKLQGGNKNISRENDWHEFLKNRGGMTEITQINVTNSEIKNLTGVNKGESIQAENVTISQTDKEAIQSFLSALNAQKELLELREEEARELSEAMKDIQLQLEEKQPDGNKLKSRLASLGDFIRRKAGVLTEGTTASLIAAGLLELMSKLPF